MKKMFTLLFVLLPVINVTCQYSGIKDSTIILFYEGKYKAVIKHSVEQINHHSDSRDTWFYLGKSYEALYQFDSAAFCFENILKSDSTDLAALNSLAANYIANRRLQRAARVYSTILAMYPHNQDAKVNLAGIYSKLGKDIEAKNLCIQLYSQDSSNSYFQNLLANCYSTLKMTDSALFFYEKYLVKNPEDFTSVVKISGLYVKEGLYRPGLAVTENYLNFDSLSIPVLKLNAYFCFLDKQFSEAVTRFLKITELGDSSFMTMKYLGLSYIQVEDMYLASGYLEKAFKIDSADIETCMYLGIATGWTINKEKGIDYLKRVFSMIQPPDETVVRIYTEIADLYVAWSQPETAVIYYLKTLDYKTDNRLVLFKLASAYEKTDKQKALDWYNDFLKTRDTDHRTVQTNSEGLIVVSYYDIAEQRIKKIQEDLFFEGNMKSE